MVSCIVNKPLQIFILFSIIYYLYQELMSHQRWRRSIELGSMTIQITSRYLKIRRCNSRVLCNRDRNLVEIECDDVQKEVEVRTVTPFRKKRCRQLMQNHQLYPMTQGNSPPLLFVSSHVFHIRLQITRFHFPYIAMNLDCDSTWQVVQVSCSFTAFSGS